MKSSIAPLDTISEAGALRYADLQAQRAWERYVRYLLIRNNRYVVPPSAVTCICKSPYTMVEVRADGLIGIGFAKKNPCDTDDVYRGIEIATFRAVRDLLGIEAL